MKTRLAGVHKWLERRVERSTPLGLDLVNASAGLRFPESKHIE